MNIQKWLQLTNFDNAEHIQTRSNRLKRRNHGRRLESEMMVGSKHGLLETEGQSTRNRLTGVEPCKGKQMVESLTADKEIYPLLMRSEVDIGVFDD